MKNLTDSLNNFIQSSGFNYKPTHMKVLRTDKLHKIMVFMVILESIFL
jgi:hypothetical protein